MKILLAVDGSAHSDAAIQTVLDRYGAGNNQVKVLSAADNLTGAFGKLNPEQSQSVLNDAMAKLCTRYDHEHIESISYHGNASQSVIKFASAWQPDLIALGAHGHDGIGRLMLGSVTDEIVKQAHCSVLVARAARKNIATDAKNIVICLEDATSRDVLLDWLVQQDWPEGARFTILHLFAPPVRDYSPNAKTDLQIFHEVEELTFSQSHVLVQEAVAKLQQLMPQNLVLCKVAEEQDVEQAIVSISKELQAGLIVVGPRHPFGMEQILLGSVANYVLLNAHCSVEIMHPQSWGAPK